MSSHKHSKLLDAINGKVKKHLTKQDLVEQLKELVKEESIELWFDTPNRAFNGLTPNQLIETGEIQLIQNIIIDMATGMPS